MLLKSIRVERRWMDSVKEPRKVGYKWVTSAISLWMQSSDWRGQSRGSSGVSAAGRSPGILTSTSSVCVQWCSLWRKLRITLLDGPWRTRSRLLSDRPAAEACLKSWFGHTPPHPPPSAAAPACPSGSSHQHKLTPVRLLLLLKIICVKKQNKKKTCLLTYDTKIRMSF